MLCILAILLSKKLPYEAAQFKALYEAHVGVTTFIVKKFKLPQQDVEEIVQEAFLKLHQLDQLLDVDRARGFLITVARNKALDLLKRGKRQKTDLMGDRIDEGAEDLWRKDPRRILEAEIVEDFWEDIKDEPGADILLDFYREGLTIREIAAKRQESIGTVTSRLSRTRTRFRDKLKARLDTEIGYEGR